MPLKIEVESLEGIDESVQGFYKPDDEENPTKYRLDVEGLPDTTGLKTALEKERAAAKDLKKKLKSYDGLDPEKYQDLLAREAQLQEADPEKIEELVQERVRKNDENWKAKYGDLQNAMSSTQARLADLLITDELRRVGGTLGVVDDEAMNDFIARGKGVFRLVDGEVQPTDSEGNVVYGESGIEPLTMSEFGQKLRDTAKHLFKSSSGGGASNTGSGNAGRGTVAAKSDLPDDSAKAAFIRKHGSKAYLELPATRQG